MKKTTTKLWLVITPVSLQPHQYMLFDGGMRHSVNSYSSLFNQGPNSPKFHGNPPHFVFTLHPSVFLHRYYHVTAQRLHQSYSHGSCKFNASLHNNLIFLMFFFFLWSGNYTFTSVLFFHQPANQKAASGAGRLSGEGGDPDVSADCQCEFVYFKRRCLNSCLICMITCCQRAFMESVAYRSSGRNINL